MSEDYYKILGTEKTATPDEIKKSYRKKAMKYHPDRNQGDAAAEAKFKAVSEAYEVLSDESKRQMYDRYGADGVKQQFGQGGFQWSDFSHADEFGDIFENMFGGGGGGGGGGIFDQIFGGGGGGQQRTRSGGMRGSDLRANIEIDFMDAVNGVEKTLKINKHEVCHTCNGTGASAGSKPITCKHCGGSGQVRMSQGFFAVAQPCPVCKGAGQVIENPCKSCHGNGRVQKQKTLNVKIPAGVDNGSRLKVAGEGEAGTRGAPAGNLYVVIHVRDHEIFQREGDNIICDVPISFPKATIGCDLEVPTVKGPINMKIPPATQSGKLLRLRGKGMPSLRGGVGDQYVRVIVETPSNLNKEQEDLLIKFADSCGETVHPQSKGFFDRVKSFVKKS